VPVRTLILLALFSPAVLVAAEPDSEPPLEVTLEVDGQAVDAAVGETATVTLDGKPRTVKLTAKPTRRFVKAGVEFRYPSHFTYGIDRESPDVTIYSVEGPAALVMVQSFTEEVGTAQAAADGVLEYLRGAYGDALTEEKEITVRLGGKTMRGRRVTANLADVVLRQEIFPIESVRGVLMVQTILDEQGAEPKETEAVRKLLADTFKAGRSEREDQ